MPPSATSCPRIILASHNWAKGVCCTILILYNSMKLNSRIAASVQKRETATQHRQTELRMERVEMPLYTLQGLLQQSWSVFLAVVSPLRVAGTFKETGTKLHNCAPLIWDYFVQCRASLCLLGPWYQLKQGADSNVSIYLQFNLCAIQCMNTFVTAWLFYFVDLRPGRQNTSPKRISYLFGQSELKLNKIPFSLVL